MIPPGVEVGAGVGLATGCWEARFCFRLEFDTLVEPGASLSVFAGLVTTCDFSKQEEGVLVLIVL